MAKRHQTADGADVRGDGYIYLTFWRIRPTSNRPGTPWKPCVLQSPGWTSDDVRPPHRAGRRQELAMFRVPVSALERYEP